MSDRPRSDHPSTEPCPPPHPEPITSHGGSAPPPPEPPALRLTDEGRDGLLLRMAPALEWLVKSSVRIEQRIERIEGRLDRIDANLELWTREDRRHGSELARLREDLDELACMRRRHNGQVPEGCPAE